MNDIGVEIISDTLTVHSVGVHLKVKPLTMELA